jgi:hypothetical protein
MGTIVGVRILTTMTATGTTSGMNAASGKSGEKGTRTGVGTGTTVDIHTAGIVDIRAAAYGSTSDVSISVWARSQCADLRCPGSRAVHGRTLGRTEQT